MKYYIFLTAFTLEDCGQVYIQFFYYERYNTELKPITIVNGIFMIVVSFKTMLDMIKYMFQSDPGKQK